MDGATEGGQAPSGNATSKPPEEAHQDTNADERRANEARHTRPPTKKEETEKTEANGKAERTRLSTPEAQPTPTEAENPATTGRNERQETEAGEAKEREPEKATQGKERTKEARETIAKTKKTLIKRA